MRLERVNRLETQTFAGLMRYEVENRPSVAGGARCPDEPGHDDSARVEADDTWYYTNPR
jgi:hypothetical protein